VRILSGHAEGDRMWVLVEDRGGGLPAEVAAAPFSPYLTTKSTGTGLGLLVCRELLGRMGADLSIENEPGVGVSVRFSLPLASEE